ncbi:MAG: hypothetical protein RLZZ110_1436 [Bacteroidota bacterium]
MHHSLVLTTMKPTRISAISFILFSAMIFAGIPSAFGQSRPTTKPPVTVAPKLNPKLTANGSKPDTLYPVSNLIKDRRFVYQLITQEYITNENDYFLDIKLDTCYLIFTAMEGERLFKMVYAADEFGTKPWAKANGLQLLPYEIQFTDRGAIESLTNWKAHRDVIMSSLSTQVQNKIITAEEFDAQRLKMNNEKIMRRLAMEDLMYLFELSDDSIREDGEYIRIKPVRSPFSGEDMYLQGNLVTERLPGTKNSVKFLTKNAAGVHEKPILLAECNEYAEAASDGKQPISEIQRVGLNNEVEYQYNLVQKVMSRVIFSDVLAINFQSRGNIRTYSLWDRK